MKRFTIAVLSFVALIGCAQDKAGSAPEPVNLTPEQMKIIGYEHGAYIAEQLKQIQELIDSESFVAGFQDALADKESPYSKEQIAEAQALFQKAMVAKQQEMMAKMEAERAAAQKAEAEASKKFLEDNAKKEGVQVTPSGLQYKVVEEGKGPKPTADQSVTVHYTGRLTDGTKFDSSVDRGQPFVLPKIEGVIPGWIEGLQLMPEGSKFTFWIPAELGYGPYGQGPIPGNAVLEFDIELIKVGE